MKDEYIPGVCNIGPAEIARRKRAGYVGLVLSFLLLGVLMLSDISPLWRLTMFFPASLAAIGFIQAYSHFCANFGFRALFNFEELSKEESVDKAEFRRKDTMKAWKIVMESMMIGLIAAVTAYFL